MRPTRVSFSAISTYETCPASYKFYYLDGIKDARPKPAAERGTRLHTACERFLKGEIELEKLSIDFRKIKPALVQLREYQAVAEEVWMVDINWNYQLEEDANTLIKGVVDIHYIIGDVLFIYDLKTGRKYPEHDDQLQLYAAMGAAKYPRVNYVLVAGLYLEGMGHPTSYTIELMPHLVDFWRVRALAPLEADEFVPTPSVEACRWCPYKKSLGGPCEY
jgi:CRISPR/Cas system-associated exonuclease Cas4 (RecB family)